jgi:ParB family transcriptional regulator, chromosome partitioning protein
MLEFVNNSIFWVEIEKIKPNPYQPRKEFDEAHLRDLSDSIRQYGILQPLTVTRSEAELPEGGMVVSYELIAGERRLRASKLAGLQRVPVIIQQGVTDPRLKLELAIIENLQREDLNPVDRALSFARLAQEFSLKHTEIAKKVGKSREYVSNTLRLLILPKEILDALSQGKITEGHARPLMMLVDRPDEQATLFKEILFKKLTVREAEQIARHIAKEKVRKKLPADPEMEGFEKALAESLGTRVSIERRPVGGGKVVIDFFSSDDLRAILEKVHVAEQVSSLRTMRESQSQPVASKTLAHATPLAFEGTQSPPPIPLVFTPPQVSQPDANPAPIVHNSTPSTPLPHHTSVQEDEDDDGELYSVQRFTI